MATLSREEIGRLLEPYLGDPPDESSPHLVDQLAVYLNLLTKWNGRINLTSVRDPGEIVRRHFGESLFAARQLGGRGTLLDLGSGAGFPGLPIQLWRPELKVTLAESQSKKATFLREVIRALALSTEVWADRVENMPSERRFDAVILRAVDNPGLALSTAVDLTRHSVWMLASAAPFPPPMKDLEILSQTSLPGASGSRLVQIRRKVFHVEQSGSS